MHGRKPGQPKKRNWAEHVAQRFMTPHQPMPMPMSTGFTGGFTPPGHTPMNLPSAPSVMPMDPWVVAAARRRRPKG